MILSMSLQDRIYKETKETYGETMFERWLNPLYMGVIDNPDGHACVTGSCGDTMEIFLLFEDDRVKQASFQTNGCGTSIVCASFASEMAIGKDPDEICKDHWRNNSGETRWASRRRQALCISCKRNPAASTACLYGHTRGLKRV